jgi:ABC-2 type transport system ATP-binding protein
VTADVLVAHGLRKAFSIPSVRRTTVREHLFGALQRRSWERLQVLDGIDLALHPGETLAVMGRNGSGKSTLLKILAGIYAPDGGRVERRAAITPILDLGVGWNPELDAIDNVYLVAAVMGMPAREIRAALDEILAFAELERFANLKLQHYSSGMAARLAYAVAFHAVREVLVLDEIFAVGDAGFRARCEARYLQLAQQGHAVLLVSHDLRIVRTYCHRAMLLEKGRVAHVGPADEVADAYLAVTGAVPPAAPPPPAAAATTLVGSPPGSSPPP